MLHSQKSGKVNYLVTFIWYATQSKEWKGKLFSNLYMVRYIVKSGKVNYLEIFIWYATQSKEWKGKLLSNLYMVRYIVKRVER